MLVVEVCLSPKKYTWLNPLFYHDPSDATIKQTKHIPGPYGALGIGQKHYYKIVKSLLVSRPIRSSREDITRSSV